MLESTLSAAIIVGGGVLLAIVGLLVVRSRVTVDTLESHHEVAGFFIGVLGAIYAVLLAFVVIVMWEKFEQAHVVVSQESNDIGDLARLSIGLPAAKRAEVRDALIAYTEAVVTEEWPAMERGEDSPRTWAAMSRLWHAYQDVSPQSFMEQAIAQGSLDKLGDLTDNRRTRLTASRDHVPAVMWAMLWGGGVVTVVFTYFFGLRNVRSQLLMTAALSLLISFVLFLIVSLNNPFAGVARVGPEPLQDELQRIKAAAYE